MKDILLQPLLNKIIVFILGICAIVLVFFVYSQGFVRIDKLNTRGDYKVIQEEQIPYESVSTFFVAEGYLFLFYDNSGLVNVYSTDGVFQYGIQVFTSTSGRGKITFSNGSLFIHSRLHIIYEFVGTNCVNCIDWTNKITRTEFARAEKVFETVNSTVWDCYQYTMAPNRSGISRQKENGPSELIIEFPQINSGAYVIALIFIGFFFVLIWLEDK